MPFVLVDRGSNRNTKGTWGKKGRILNRKELQRGISSAPLPQSEKLSLRFSNSDLEIQSTALAGVWGEKRS